MTSIQQLRMLALVAVVVAVMVVSLMLPTNTYASNVIQRVIYVNDSPIQSSIIVRNHYQMVPASWFKNLSAKVSWSKQYRSAIVCSSSNQTVIGFPLGQSFTDYDLNGLNQWVRDDLDTINFIYEGRMYVPLAYTARKLGMQVTYDAQSQRTSILHGKTKTTHNTEAKNARNTEAKTALITEAKSASERSISSDDLHWLYQITEAEAGGESYKGKVAVAASILNRVENPAWPNSIKKIVFQVTKLKGVSYYQYSPVLDNRIYNMKPSKDTIKAVKAALSGEDTSKGAVVFYNPDKTHNQWVRRREVTVKIGNHVFAR